jgi:hypothetical protein
MVEIVFNENIQPHNKAEIEKHLLPLLWLMPSWCVRLFINLPDNDPDDGDCIADTTTDFAYRFIRINIYSAWLNRPDLDKTKYLIHELIHGFTNTSYHQARRTIRILADNNADLKSFALNELSSTNEAQVCDLAHAIYQKFIEREWASS